MNEDEKLVIARAEDLFTLCDRYGSPVFSGCLDGAEQAVIEDNHALQYGYNTLPDGEEIYYISNPALGLWAHPDRFKD